MFSVISEWMLYVAIILLMCEKIKLQIMWSEPWLTWDWQMYNHLMHLSVWVDHIKGIYPWHPPPTKVHVRLAHSNASADFHSWETKNGKMIMCSNAYLEQTSTKVIILVFQFQNLLLLPIPLPHCHHHHHIKHLVFMKAFLYLVHTL
jgi:hypothetical protein